MDNRYLDVDALQAQTTLDEAAAKCGTVLDTKGTGTEVRIDCPFNCPGDHAGRKELSVNTANPQKVFQCHAYQCQFRGNLLTIMHGLLTGTRPTGDKLKGTEFQRVKKVLAANAADAEPATPVKSTTGTVSAPANIAANIPLAHAAEDKVRELDTIDAKFVRDVAAMNPVAAGYVRRHSCLSADAMAKWRCGYLPHDGGGDKRGWSLRGGIVYGIASESGQVLAWVGRDVQYEDKERDYARLSAAERKSVAAPVKHRFPKGFHRGLELYGQQSARLREPGYREFVAQHGLTVVEGFNDVIALDAHGVPALGLLSNRMTEAQADKLARFARQVASGRVNLLFDNDAAGIEGAKEAVWHLAQRQLDVRVAWSRESDGGRYANREPESLDRDTLLALLRVDTPRLASA